MQILKTFWIHKNHENLNWPTINGYNLKDHFLIWEIPNTMFPTYVYETIIWIQKFGRNNFEDKMVELGFSFIGFGEVDGNLPNRKDIFNLPKGSKLIWEPQMRIEYIKN